mmetsp:Transcript_18514/g.37086  ORF Transcript_18514/g.37086 Transcript_18514/m.37086 type:complete len:260 (-) Transcript_18514:31-810(-)
MARPEEKAGAMLNKWLSMKREHDSDPTSLSRSGKRPYLSTLVTDLNDAQFWRRQIVKEIATQVGLIQNKGLGDAAVREMNDGINKLLREKWHWNNRVKSLGGPDFNKLERAAATSAEDEEGGDTVLGTRKGYKYFGAARDLPGVREMFAKNAGKIMKRSRGDLWGCVDGEYYGIGSEDDGVLIAEEEKREGEYMEDVRRKRVKTVGRDDAAMWREKDVTSGEEVEKVPRELVGVDVVGEGMVKKVVLEMRKREAMKELI